MGQRVLYQDLPLEGITVCSPLFSDAEYIAEHMREADRFELSAHGREPLEALEDGMNDSQFSLTVLREDRPVLMFGVAPGIEPGHGIIWLLSTDELLDMKKSFLRHSKEWLETLGLGYSYLSNVVDARNTVHVRWLKWMGMEFLGTISVNGHPFISFGKLTH